MCDLGVDKGPGDSRCGNVSYQCSLRPTGEAVNTSHPNSGVCVKVIGARQDSHRPSRNADIALKSYQVARQLDLGALALKTLLGPMAHIGVDAWSDIVHGDESLGFSNTWV